MSEATPPPISETEKRRRERRIKALAKKLGFRGKVEYHHILSGTGGAQIRIGEDLSADLLLVFAEAFQRDADPEDFSLSAILAHERGHQILARHPKLKDAFASGFVLKSEEILASLLGSLVAESEDDRRNLFEKALFEALEAGLDTDHAVRLLHDLRELMEKIL